MKPVAIGCALLRSPDRSGLQCKAGTSASASCCPTGSGTDPANVRGLQSNPSARARVKDGQCRNSGYPRECAIAMSSLSTQVGGPSCLGREFVPLQSIPRYDAITPMQYWVLHKCNGMHLGCPPDSDRALPPTKRLLTRLCNGNIAFSAADFRHQALRPSLKARDTEVSHNAKRQ